MGATPTVDDAADLVTAKVYDRDGNLKTEEKLVKLDRSEYAGGTIVSAWQYVAGKRVTRQTDPRGNYWR